MNSSDLESIASFVPLSETLATAGQPTDEQLVAIAAAGFKVIINLGLHDDPSYSLTDERASVASLGLQYVHIPVQFTSPTFQALAAFSAAMSQAGDGKVFVHCRHNKRVPVFVALDRILRQGWDPTEALDAMRTVWRPDETWQKFIDESLAKNAG